MEIARGYQALGRRLRAPVVAIGNFDGVHRGHARIFEETKALARELGVAGAESVVLTFEPHPARVLAPTYAPPLISTPRRKLELIAAAGIDVAVVQPFDRELAGRSPEAFVDEVLVKGLGARGVCVGHDFTFGKKRAGTTATLEALGLARGFRVRIVPAFSVDGMVCSSTKVREFVLEGRVDAARLVLGRDYELEGEVVHGDGRGRTIGIPTANVRAENELLPKNGVYAGWAELLDAEGGRRFGAAINVGTNPTFVAEGSQVRIEAHLLDTEIDLYGRRLRLGFTGRLRGEERFPSPEALVTQIRRDVEAARAAFRERG